MKFKLFCFFSFESQEAVYEGCGGGGQGLVQGMGQIPPIEFSMGQEQELGRKQEQILLQGVPPAPRGHSRQPVQVSK